MKLAQGNPVEVGKEICSPWSPKRVLEIKPYEGLYTDLFDCTLVVWANSRSGTTEVAYNSSDWEYDQHRVAEWYKENKK